MAGGPSHIDTWDPKPDRPLQNRGPFGVIPTRLPGVLFCEHLPKQAAMLDRFTIIRSVDARHSNHEPNKVFQTGNLDAAPRINPSGEMYPAIGSVVAKHHGANRPGMPPYVAFQTSRTHIAFAGYLGQQYDPFIANRAARLPIYTNVGVDTGRTTEADFFRLPAGLTHERLPDRRALLAELDRLRREIDRSGAVEAMDRYGQQAVEMLVGRRAQAAFDLSQEPEAVRDRYGKHLWCQQALLARRLVEAGVAFVTHRPELPHGLGHLGQPRRQHPALRRHQQGTQAAAAALRPPDHDAGRPTWRSGACSTTCWCWPWASSAGRR